MNVLTVDAVPLCTGGILATYAYACVRVCAYITIQIHPFHGPKYIEIEKPLAPAIALLLL